MDPGGCSTDRPFSLATSESRKAGFNLLLSCRIVFGFFFFFLLFFLSFFLFYMSLFPHIAFLLFRSDSWWSSPSRDVSYFSVSSLFELVTAWKLPVITPLQLSCVRLSPCGLLLPRRSLLSVPPWDALWPARSPSIANSFPDTCTDLDDQAQHSNLIS